MMRGLLSRSIGRFLYSWRLSTHWCLARIYYIISIGNCSREINDKMVLTDRRVEEQRLQKQWAEETAASIKRFEERKAAKKRADEIGVLEEELAEQKRLEKEQAEHQRLEELNKIYSNEKERLIYIEKKSRSVDALTEIPKEKIELMELEILTQQRLNMQQISVDIVSPLQERKSPIILNSQEVFPKKCMNCPDHKNYFEEEIHRCPDCGEWICGRHYHGHVLKKHGSQEYSVQSNENGQGNYKFPK